MRAEKSNFTVNSSLLKISSISRPTNITDLIKRNKLEEKEEKREKMFKIYMLLSFVGLFLMVIFLNL